MSKRPNIASDHERAIEQEIQQARGERDEAMADRMEAAGTAPTADPQPYILSFSRGPANHEVPAEVQAWIAEREAEQLEHYQRIYREIEQLAPYRDQWIEEFFDRISGPRGFSVHAGQRKTIPKDQIPTRPDRPWRVVW